MSQEQYEQERAKNEKNEKDLNWCANRALAIYDRGMEEYAIDSFINDVTKCPGIAWVAPKAKVLLRNALGSREEFEKALRGFNVSD
jgi:hypothetical protein